MNGYIRVAIFNTPNLIEEAINSSSNWINGNDGYFYYDSIVAGGERTETLTLKFNTRNIKKPNIIVVSEITGTTYDHSGEAYADWNRKIEIVE